MFVAWRSQTRFAVALIVATVVALSGCAAKKQPWGDPETGLILTYRMQETQPLAYRVSFDQTQNLEIQGQSIKSSVEKTNEFTLTCTDDEADGFQLLVTIDAMTMNIASPQGDVSPDMDGLTGKSFEMFVTRLGEQQDFAGAEEIEYELGPGDIRNISPDFQAFLPKLADRPVKIGETWTASNTVNDKSENADIRIQLQSVNTLDGVETVDGVECARITATITGTLEGTGTDRGADLTFTGELEGTETWYFAYEEGAFVRSSAEVSTTATVDVAGPESMTVPMIQELKIEARLIR